MFNFWQLVELAVWGLLFAVAVRYRDPRVWCVCCFVAIILFMFNPVKMEPKSTSSLENFNRFDTIPEKVEVERESFEESQKRELEELRNESEEMIDED